MFRFYHRTSHNSGYSNGVFFETLRVLWPMFIILVFVGAIVGTLEGQIGSLFLVLAMGAGGYWGWKTRRG
jgi:hypothetical protein